MWWKLKAAIHRSISLLPDRLGYSANFFLQRRFGRLASADPSLEHLQAGKRFADEIIASGRTLQGTTVLEIGTGWQLDLSIALWLCGAERVVTVDVNPYLESEVVLAHLAYLKSHGEIVRGMFGSFASTPLFRERYRALMRVPDTLQSLIGLTGISYRAPADTARLDLPDASVDYYISYNVDQYITRPLLEEVLREGKRVLKPGGLHLHAIDLTDWFAESDPSISRINFLRFSEQEWKKYAGNRFMYQNRLRVDDYTSLFGEMEYDIHRLEVTRDNRAIDVLKSGFPLDKEFKEKSIETNATSSAWIVASPTVSSNHSLHHRGQTAP